LTSWRRGRASAASSAWRTRSLTCCFELEATERKSRTSSIKRNAWPNKKTKVNKSVIVSQ
jgi:hypothetical protein